MPPGPTVDAAEVTGAGLGWPSPCWWLAGVALAAAELAAGATVDAAEVTADAAEVTGDAAEVTADAAEVTGDAADVTVGTAGAGGAEVAACACRENTSKMVRIPAAKIATCTAR